MVREAAEHDWLGELAAAVADGRVLDWDALESSADSDADRAAIRRLRVIAAVGQAHGELTFSDTVSESQSVRTILQGTEDASTPASWGSLRILERVGRGRFGDVYRAWDPTLDREVALKLLRRRDAQSNQADHEVIEEGRLMARVRHPNVVAVYGAQRIDGRTGLWMEFVQGRTLEAELKERGPIPSSEVLQIGIELCRALSAVHEASLVHRDVKAQNVMRDATGRIVLGDFGTGQEFSESAPAQLAGTPAYLAPEVLDGAPATRQSDIYSLGVLLFRLLTGSYPVQGRSIGEIRAAHGDGTRVRISEVRSGLPAKLIETIERALAPRPTDRFASAPHMERALATCVGARPHRLALAVAFVVAAVVLVAVWGFGSDRWNAPAPIRLNAGDWILVADIDNQTGEEVLDGTIGAAVKRELEYSEFVRVAQRDRVEDALRALGQPLDSRLDRGLARKMALRDGGLRAELAGRVDSVAGGYEITLDLIAPGDDRTVTSVREKVSTQGDILPAVRNQVLGLREALGETPASVDRSRKLLASVRVPSIRALHLYTQASTMMNLRLFLPQTRAAVVRLTRLAVQEDPMFARAVIMLAYFNQDAPVTDLRAAERAFELANTATPQERYFIIGSFHHMIAGGPFGSMTPQRRAALERAVAAYEALFALQPDHYDLVNNLRNVYLALGRDRDRASMDVRLAEARPLSVIENLGVAAQLLREGNWDGARRFAARAESALPRGAAAAPPRQTAFTQLGIAPPARAAEARLFGAYIAWLENDSREALRIADRVRSTARDLYPDDQRELYLRLWVLYAALGRLHQAGEVIKSLRGTDDSSDRNSVLETDQAEAVFLSITNQPDRLRELMAIRAREPLGPDTPSGFAVRILPLIETGLFELAERDLEWFKPTIRTTDNPGPKFFYESARAHLERARGHLDAAISGFQKARTLVATDANPDALGDSPGGYYVALPLASIFESVGRLPEAIAELEHVGGDRVGVVIQNILGPWLDGRAQLARLYRKNGQDEKAREVEAHLLKLLAMADADHPLVKELRARN
jgi:serine/threonine-protein kinase